MGRGNYCPSGEMTDQWYIDHEMYQLEDEAGEYEIDFDLMQEDISEVMEAIKKRFPSFHDKNRFGDNYWGERYMLENQLFWIGTADNQWSEAIFIKERDDLGDFHGALARRHFPRYCEAIKQILLEMFGTIYLRNGPWMSSKLTLEVRA